MYYPTMLNNLRENKESTLKFLGYNHTQNVPDGAFFDMKNISTADYPSMSLRRKRGKVKTFTRFQGMMEKDGHIAYVDNGKLYIDGALKSGTLTNTGMKTLVKMGSNIIVFPDKKWFGNTDSGSLDVTNNFNGTVSMVPCNQKGATIIAQAESYYKTHEPQNGDYMLYEADGKSSLKIYSAATQLWSAVPTTYVKITATNIGASLEPGDGVVISSTLFTDGKSTFLTNVDSDKWPEKRSYGNFVIHSKDTNYIIVPGFIGSSVNTSGKLSVERKAPEMSFVVECQNRLWGCSADGHEVYCCKLGDFKNWNCFAGISTDSWAATIGSDGLFTGAASYMGHPIFFKEDSIIRVTISSQGAHRINETIARGIKAGSDKSLCQVNELLYYHSLDGVCVYDGQFPQKISDALGAVIYSNAVAGTINGRYYICMGDTKPSLFTYKDGLWAKEDNIRVDQFCNISGNLQFVSNNVLYSIDGVTGELEKDFDWFAETGKLGFVSVSQRSGRDIGMCNLHKVSIKMSLENKSFASLEVEYDSSGEWIQAWQLYGKGTQTFVAQFKPRRCDHFRLRLKGHGDAKVYAITRTYVEGGDK